MIESRRCQRCPDPGTASAGGRKRENTKTATAVSRTLAYLLAHVRKHGWNANPHEKEAPDPKRRARKACQVRAGTADGRVHTREHSRTPATTTGASRAFSGSVLGPDSWKEPPKHQESE